jgi:hypothetical protein
VAQVEMSFAPDSGQYGRWYPLFMEFDLLEVGDEEACGGYLTDLTDGGSSDESGASSVRGLAIEDISHAGNRWFLGER